MGGEVSEVGPATGPDVQHGSDPRPSPRSAPAPIIPEMPHPDSGVVVRPGKGWERQTIAQWEAERIRDGLFRNVEVVTDNLGPIWLLWSRDNTSHSPMPIIGAGDHWTVVWVCSARRPWGCSDPFQIFYGHRHESAARTYANKLADRLRVAAEAEQERLDRVKEAYCRDIGTLPTDKHTAWLNSFADNLRWGA